MVASRLWTSLLDRVVARQIEARAALDPSGAGAQPEDQEAEAVGSRLTSPPQLLDRLMTVRPGTVAVLVSAGEPSRLAFPGEHLSPKPLPRLDSSRVLVVSTTPVALDVSIDRLRSLDGFDIERTTIRVTVQVSEDQGYDWLPDLVTEHGSGLEGHWLDRVRTEVVSGAQSALRMNRLADVRRLTLPEVLSDPWLPKTFADRRLVRRDLAVLGHVWPAEDDQAPVVPVPASPGPASSGG